MSIFSSNYDNDIIIEGYGVETNGHVDIMMEAYEDQLAVIEAIHEMDTKELHFLKEAKSDDDYDNDKEDKDDEETEEVLKEAANGVIAKIKEMASKFFAKIRGWFKTLIDFFKNIIGVNKKFIMKYSGKLKKADTSNYTHEMYNFIGVDKIEKRNIAGSGLLAGMKASYELGKKAREIVNAEGSKHAEYEEEINAIVARQKVDQDAYRGQLVGANNAVSAEDFSDALFNYFRNDGKYKEEAKKESRKVDVNNIITALNRVDGILKNAESCEKDVAKVEEMHKGAVKGIEASLNDTSTPGASLAIKYANTVTSGTLTSCGITTTYFNALKTAVNEIINTYKSIVLDLVGEKKTDDDKKDDKTEQ